MTDSLSLVLWVTRPDSTTVCPGGELEGSVPILKSSQHVCRHAAHMAGVCLFSSALSMCVGPFSSPLSVCVGMQHTWQACAHSQVLSACVCAHSQMLSACVQARDTHAGLACDSVPCLGNVCCTCAECIHRFQCWPRL